jgi:hypothetical protein
MFNKIIVEKFIMLIKISRTKKEIKRMFNYYIKILDVILFIFKKFRFK